MSATLTKPKAWSREDERYLRRFYATRPLGLLARELRRTMCAVKARASWLHLSKGRRHFTPEEDQLLRAQYPRRSAQSVAKILGREVSSIYNRAGRLDLKKTPEYMASLAAIEAERLMRTGAGHRFPKGHVPANKGLRRPGWSPGRMRETQFKKGQLNGTALRNMAPIGTIRTDSDGYLREKISYGHGGFGNPKTWRLVHRHNWEEAHGPVPAGHAVTFKNGNKQNPALENLELITRKELRRRNSIHAMYSPELKSTIFVAGWLKRRIRKALDAQKQNAGSARSPVRSDGAAKRRR